MLTFLDAANLITVTYRKTHEENDAARHTVSLRAFRHSPARLPGLTGGIRIWVIRGPRAAWFA